MTPALSREERAAEVLREHVEAPIWSEVGGVWSWRCPCGAVLFGTEGAPKSRTVPGVRFLTLAHAAHHAAMLAAAGLLADPDALAKAFCCDWSGCPGDHPTADNYCTARRRYGTEEPSDD